MGARSNTLPTSEQRRREIEREWTQLTFHYGLSFEDIAHMPRWARKLYLSALPRLLAEQQLSGIETAAFTKLTKSARNSTMRRLERSITGVMVQSIKPKSQDEMAMAAAALGFGVRVLDREGNEVAV